MDKEDEKLLEDVDKILDEELGEGKTASGAYLDSDGTLARNAETLERSRRGEGAATPAPMPSAAAEAS